MAWAQQFGVALSGDPEFNSVNQYGIGRSDKNYASKTQARIARNDYYNWLNTYRPIESELRASYNNPVQRAEAAAEAQSLVAQGFDTAAAANERRMRGIGVVLTPEQQASQDRAMNVRRGLADVNAFNQTMRRYDERDAAILYGAPSRSVGG